MPSQASTGPSLSTGTLAQIAAIHWCSDLSTSYPVPVSGTTLHRLANGSVITRGARHRPSRAKHGKLKATRSRRVEVSHTVRLLGGIMHLKYRSHRGVWIQFGSPKEKLKGYSRPDGTYPTWHPCRRCTHRTGPLAQPEGSGGGCGRGKAALLGDAQAEQYPAQCSKRFHVRGSTCTPLHCNAPNPQSCHDRTAGQASNTTRAQPYYGVDVNQRGLHYQFRRPFQIYSSALPESSAANTQT